MKRLSRAVFLLLVASLGCVGVLAAQTMSEEDQAIVDNLDLLENLELYEELGFAEEVLELEETEEGSVNVF